MRNLKKYSFLLSIICFLSLSQCSSSDEPGPNIIIQPGAGVPTGACKILTYSRSSSPYLFSYNANGSLKDVLFKYLNSDSYAQRTTFEYSIGKISIYETNSGNIETLSDPELKKIISFNTDGTPNELRSASGALLLKFVYKSGMLSYYINQEEFSSSQGQDSVLVNWDANKKNITSIQQFRKTATSDTYSAHETLEYIHDGNPNPFKGLIHYDGIWLEYFNQNNIVKNGSDSYLFSYNDKNYPVSSTLAGKPSQVESWTYECK